MTTYEATQTETPRTGRPWRDMLAALGALLVPGIAAGVLLAIVPAPQSEMTVRTDVGLTDAVAVEEPSMGSEAEAISREKRLRDIELQLAAARRQEEKEQRYQQSFANGVMLETAPGTPIFAFGRAGDLVKVSCEETEFGQVATLATSAEPSAFFVARYLSDCAAGELATGTEIGTTLGPLGWEQHNQVNGAAEEPNLAFIEWALSGYTGEYAAPTAEINLHLDEIKGAIRSFFTEPLE